VVPLLAHEAFRLWYYGLPLPLPFYVKLESPAAFPGLWDVGDWLGGHGLRLGLLLLFALLRPLRSLIPAIAAVASLTAFFVFPEHLMGYQSRYLSPLDPTCCVLAGIGLGRVVRIRWLLRVPRSASMVAVSLALVVGALGWLDLPEAKEEQLSYANGLQGAHERLGRMLSGSSFRDKRLALSDGGAISYLSDLWTLDLTGLNDARIATTGEREPEWVFSQHVDLLVLVSRSARQFEPAEWNSWERPIFEEARRRGFRCASQWRFADDYRLWLMVPSVAVARTVHSVRASGGTACPG
jgi:hypothetical protein